MTTSGSISAIGGCIRHVRGSDVILDADLARLYQVPTKRLNEQVRRNPDRFPADFVFQLVQTEFESLRSQFATLDAGRGKHRKYLPLVFTEQGATMVSAVLNSDRAVEVSIAIMRAFVQVRKDQGSSSGMAQKVEKIEERLNELEVRNDKQSQSVLAAIHDLKSLMIATVPSEAHVGKFVASSPANLQYHPGANLKDDDLEIRTLVEPKTHKIKVTEIFKSVAAFYGLEVSILKASTREKGIVLPRQVAIYLIRRLTEMPYKDIGLCFRGKNHSTIMHACRKIKKGIEGNKEIREAVEEILTEL